MRRDYGREAAARAGWLAEILAQSGAKGFVFGASGGKDSVLVGALCKMACENTVGLILPIGAQSTDVEHAKIACGHFDIESVVVDLTATKSSMLDAFGGDLSHSARVNVAPRLRMTALYAAAAERGALVVGTSNRSEIYLGYFTKWGDGGSDLNPIADLTATEVLEFLEFLGAPEIFYTKPPSAGLYEGQTDEAEFGFTYKELDEFLLQNKEGENFERIQKLHKSSHHKRRNIPKFVMIILMFVILVACGGREPERAEILPLDVNYALDAAFERRLGVERPSHETLLELAQGRRPLTFEQMAEYGHIMDGNWANAALYALIPIEDAKADIRDFFTVLRHAYGGYLYFGGDAVFVPVMEAILEEIAARGIEIRASDMELILRNRIFEVIVDNHFVIGGRSFNRNAHFYDNANLKFDKTPEGFRNRESGLYVSELRNHDKAQVFRLSINNQGELYYTPVVMTFAMNPTYRLFITYDDGSEIQHNLSHAGSPRRSFRTAQMEFIDGIPVVSVMQMGFTAHDNS
ncbi:MAG: NAD(+) synthase [Clostridiales bacterium]|jgi:NAD+ synthase|nr:NAD(+) synthase [Clostridiales bacterium]